MAELTSKSPCVFQEEVASESKERDASSLDSQLGWHGDKAIPEISEWSSAEELKNGGLKIWFLNAALLVFPASFLGLSLYIASLNGQSVRTDGTDIETVLQEDLIYYAITQSLKVAVTIYPILFGLVLCRLLKSVVNYKAERGTRLITLEQIMASKSFGSALTAPLSFKGISTTTLVLFLIWATSPITSQALQRVFTTSTATTGQAEQVTSYLNVLDEAPNALQQTLYRYPFGQSGRAEYIDFDNDTSLPIAEITAATSLQSILKAQSNDSKISEVDVFGFPKIPVLSSTIQDLGQNAGGWYDAGMASIWPFSWGKSIFDKYVPSSGNDVEWASLIGQPLLYVPRNTTSYSSLSTLSITTGYWTLDCSDVVLQSELALGPASDWHTNAAGPLTQADETAYMELGNATLGAIQSLTIAMKLKFAPDSDVNNLPELQFAARSQQQLPVHNNNPKGNNAGNFIWQFATTTCQWHRQIVDVEFGCAGGQCSTARMRLSNYSKGPPYDHGPNFQSGTWISNQRNLTKYFIHSFLSANAVRQPEHSQPPQPSSLEYFLASGQNGVSVGSTPDFAGLPAKTFSQRLSQALNTYWAVAMAPGIFSMVSTDAASTLEEAMSSSPDAFPSLMNTTAIVDHQRPVYKCHWVWLAVMLVSCVLVIFIIILNAVLESRTLAPDVLGYVSSLTFDNRYIPLPNGGSTIAALERSRKLANLKVRIQDVTPDAEVGHVALGTVEGAPLQQGRRYL